MIHRLAKGHDVARGLVALPDGGLIVAAELGGYLKPHAGPDAALVRLLPAGGRDETFGKKGMLRVSIGRGNDRVSGVARLADGRLVAGGAARNLSGEPSGNEHALYAFRARPSGALDPSFGRRGIASVRVQRRLNSALSGIAVSPDGGIVVGGGTDPGSSDPARLILARFDARGRLDRSFGGDGIVSHRVRYPYALTRYPNGGLIVVGMTDLRRDWFVLRLRADGTRDPSFGGGDGLVVTSFGRPPDAAHAVAVDPRGRIVVAGKTTGGPSCETNCVQLRLVRYLANGRVDPSFGRSGRTAPGLGFSRDTIGLAIDRNGGILVAGANLVPKSQDDQLAVWRFLPDGRLDRSFGARGVLEVNPTSGPFDIDYLTQVITRPDGRIVAAGGSATRTISDVAVLQAR